MSNEKYNMDRRDFLKTAASAGLGSAFMLAKGFADTATPQDGGQSNLQKMPARELGKSGLKVSCLSLGANKLDNQMMLRSALNFGVSCWDTARSYMAGTSENTIGKFLQRSPESRKNIVIVTKASGPRDPSRLEERLQESLQRMNTDYIDVYYGWHGINKPEDLDNNEVKKWAEGAKKRNLVRCFGFSTHQNMAPCLLAAAKAGWIDAITTTYNFRVIQDPQMQAAVDACHKAGIGLMAMKVIANTLQDRDKLEAGQPIDKTDADEKLIRHFTERGFDEHQAKIKIVLDDERIASACVGTYSVANLKSNVEAATDEKKISQADKQVLAEYARATCSSYCAGCGRICNTAVPNVPCISEVMRFLMYNNSYGDKARAKELFAQLPADVRGRLLTANYKPAEACCPQRLPIARLVAEAVHKLA